MYLLTKWTFSGVVVQVNKAFNQKKTGTLNNDAWRNTPKAVNADRNGAS